MGRTVRRIGQAIGRGFTGLFRVINLFTGVPAGESGRGSRRPENPPGTAR